jgi:hypothetical protein
LELYSKFHPPLYIYRGGGGILLEIGYYEILIISPKTVKSIDEIIVKKAKLINPKYPRSRILSSFL